MTTGLPLKMTDVGPELSRALTLDEVSLRALRARRLRDSVQHARRVSLFWRERLASLDIDDPESTLRNVPVLTRSELVESLPELSGNATFTPDRLASAASKPSVPIQGDLYVIATGGSSGGARSSARLTT
jgi:hypothetical protein